MLNEHFLRSASVLVQRLQPPVIRRLLFDGHFPPRVVICAAWIASTICANLLSREKVPHNSAGPQLIPNSLIEKLVEVRKNASFEQHGIRLGTSAEDHADAEAARQLVRDVIAALAKAKPELAEALGALQHIHVRKDTGAWAGMRNTAHMFVDVQLLKAPRVAQVYVICHELGHLLGRHNDQHLISTLFMLGGLPPQMALLTVMPVINLVTRLFEYEADRAGYLFARAIGEDPREIFRSELYVSSARARASSRDGKVKKSQSWLELLFAKSGTGYERSAELLKYIYRQEHDKELAKAMQADFDQTWKTMVPPQIEETTTQEETVSPE
ncbi:MAG: hypothetical protein MHM6MM_001192 [Cercozoa sp. M6MM]